MSARPTVAPSRSARARLGLCGLVGLLGLSLGLVACHFNVEPVVVGIGDAGIEDLAIDDLASDASTEDMASPDLAGLCAAGGPTSGCSVDGESLLTCQGTMPVATKCDDGCSPQGTPHCKRLDPGGVVDPSDYELPGLGDVMITDDAVFNTDTGAITAGGIDRAGGVGVQGGIGFRSAAQVGGSPVGIFSFKSLLVSTNGAIRIVGSKPLVLVASGDITVNGVIDGQGQCSSTVGVGGGGAGGAPKAGNGGAGGGVGGGGAGLVVVPGGGGGGGGGFGDVGGAGAGTSTNANAGGAAGPLFGDFTVSDPVLSGGGGGGAGGGVVAGGAGGSGGGAVQIATNANVRIGGSAVLQVGGCHGNRSTGGGGGGGGAGGLVFIEARTIDLSSGATLAANGGAGAGGNGSDGDDGSPDEDAAQGGSAGGNGSDGGDGGHTGSLFGRPGQTPGNSDTTGGGGGGAVGRIALKSKSGMVATGGVTLSPKVGENTPGRAAPAIIGTVQFR